MNFGGKGKFGERIRMKEWSYRRSGTVQRRQRKWHQRWGVSTG